MSDIVAALNLDNGTVITVTRSNGETIVTINGNGNGNGNGSEARLGPRERSALSLLLTACGAFDR